MDNYKWIRLYVQPLLVKFVMYNLYVISEIDNLNNPLSPRIWDSSLSPVMTTYSKRWWRRGGVYDHTILRIEITVRNVSQMTASDTASSDDFLSEILSAERTGRLNLNPLSATVSMKEVATVTF